MSVSIKGCCVKEEEVSDIPKHRKVAMELLSTERSYVKTLQLIDQVSGVVSDVVSA